MMMPGEGDVLWTARQRTALLMILVPVIAYIVVRTLRNPAYVPDPQPIEPSRANELADRIDPNTADVETLGALPTLGEKRAKLIVEYRDRYQKLFPNAGPVYQRPEDLLRIRGIGVATVEQIKPFLTFSTSTTAPTTAPTTSDD